MNSPELMQYRVELYCTLMGGSSMMHCNVLSLNRIQKCNCNLETNMQYCTQGDESIKQGFVQRDTTLGSYFARQLCIQYIQSWVELCLKFEIFGEFRWQVHDLVLEEMMRFGKGSKVSFLYKIQPKQEALPYQRFEVRSSKVWKVRTSNF